MLEKQPVSINSYNNDNNNVGLVVSEYDKQRAEYIERLHNYNDNFENIALLEFYNNGKLIVNYNGNVIEANINALYLRYGYINNTKFIFLSNVLNGRNVDFFTNHNYAFAEKYPIIEFRNTTLFEILCKKYGFMIKDNCIMLGLNETNELISYIYNWDGKVNDIVPETMAVKNKQVWDVNFDGKKR